MLLNDVHVSKDNIQEFHANWDEALSVCKDKGITDLILGGDLWQSRSSQTLSTLLAVRDALIKARRMEIDVTIAEGNHCKVDQESILGYGHVFDRYPGVLVIDEVATIPYGDNVTLYVMSYFPENGSFTKRFSEIVKGLNHTKVNILYIHEGINGALAHASDNELPSKIFKDFDKVLVGHYHNRCRIEGTNIEYIGSSRQHNFGEDEEKGYTVLYTDGSTEFIKNKANLRYKVFELSDKEIRQDGFIREIREFTENPKYLVKTKICCDTKEVAGVDKAKLLEIGVSKIDIVTKDTVVGNSQSSGLDVKFDKSGIKKEYSGFCEQKEIKDVEFGLRYLDKIA